MNMREILDQAMTTQLDREKLCITSLKVEKVLLYSKYDILIKIWTLAANHRYPIQLIPSMN